MDLREQILKEHSVKNAICIAKYVESNPESLPNLLSVILHGDKVVAQRGAWVLSKFSDSFYKEFISYLDIVFAEVKSTTHTSVRRNIAKVFVKITEPKSNYYLTEDIIDSIVDISFSWLISGKEKPAVVAYSMGVLKNMLGKRPWVVSELKFFIENNITDSPPSFKAVGKKVLKYISVTFPIA